MAVDTMALVSPRVDGRRPGAMGGSARVQLGLLRGFELRCDGTTVPLLMGPQRLIAFLGLQERSLPRSYVAETLWADVPDRRAWASLRSALWRMGALRQRLVDQIGDHLRLSPEVVVDVRQADEAALELIAGTFASETRLDPSVFVADLLPGWCDDWILIERERHRQLGLQALELLCERLTEEGQHRRAVQAGLAAVRGDPLRESAQRALILAHLAGGNVSDAIRQFELFERLLRHELGLEPSERLQRLITTLGDPST
jgi:DNA-binding SARP family transcriptional activator